jgi:hypothetical protein
MAHIADDMWVDFARGTLPSDRAAIIVDHLDGGCKRCRRIRDLWVSVAERAVREQGYVVSEEALHLARAQFRSLRAQRKLNAVAAALMFDSHQAAYAAGVRSGVTPALRHLLYQAGSFSLDFRVEPTNGSGELALTGQIADAKRVTAGIPRSKVLLLQGDRELAQTETNRVGEFEFQFEPQEELALMVLVKGRQPILVQLSDVLGNRPD